MEYYAHITGWGMALPEKVVTNHDLAQTIDTSDEWIVSRTGIRERRIAGPKESTATLALAAAKAALEVADLSPTQLDLVIVATTTPEYLFPTTACLVQDALGATHAGAFDLLAACSGFVYALNLGTQVIRSGSMQNILIIGAETYSRIVNWKDRSTCILFGDGAGAFILQRRTDPGGVLAGFLRADGSGSEALKIPAGGSRLPASLETVQNNLHTIRMDGPEVFKFATRVMASAVREVTRQANLKLEDINLIVPHQANRRIIDNSARALKLPEDKFFINVDRYANTSAASIPIAVCEAIAQKRLHPNDYVVLVGFGAGLTWAASAIKWNVTPPVEVSRWRRYLRQAAYLLARGRSLLLRGWRHIEAMFYGSQSPEGGQEPPHRSPPPDDKAPQE